MFAATGREPAELRAPPAPPALQYLLGVFAEIASGRQSAFAPMPIPLTEIDAYVRLSGMELDWWECRVIRLLDRVWLSAWREGQTKVTD